MTTSDVTCAKCRATWDPRYWFCPDDGMLMLLGRVVGGEWAIEAALGSGAMGAVYRARHRLDGRLAAVKILGPRMVTNEGDDDVLRFLRESAMRVRHANCAEIYDVGRLSDAQGQKLTLFWIRMEYVDGTTLDRTPTPVPWSRLSQLAVEMCAGLAACHEAGIVHRDLKPANMLIAAATGTLKVGDFGIARLAGAPTLTGQGGWLGTPFYMAPELFQGARGDERSDLWALGVVLYELMTGRHPFAAPTADVWTLVARVLADDPFPLGLASYPAGLEAIVLRLLKKRPEDRFASAVAVREAILDLTLVRVQVINRDLVLDVTLSVSRQLTLAQVRALAIDAASPHLSIAALNVFRSPHSHFFWMIGDRPAADAETLGSACPAGHREPIVLHLRVHAHLLLEG